MPTVPLVPGTIHDDHPFLDPEDERHPIRRFRGRLSVPVTIVTSGSGRDRTGLTVSSLMVAEGDPPRIHFLLGDQTYLWDQIRETGRFVVHVLEDRHRNLSSRFAGVVPSPGGPFAGIDIEEGGYGPVIVDIATRADCSFEKHHEGDGAYVVVDGLIDDVHLHDLSDPLQWFRGSYRRLAE